MTAADLDSGNNARLSYRLEKSSGTFQVNQNTGWISIAGHLDREYIERYKFTILASDNGLPAATASAIVVVNVIDENDNQPRFNQEIYAFEVLENLPAGIPVGTVSATDPDAGNNGFIKYAIVQRNSSFVINPKNGAFLH